MVAKKASRTSRQPASSQSKTSARPEPGISDVQELHVDQYVIDPAHGVGKIIARVDEVIAGKTTELFLINFPEERMTLRFPVANIASSGLRSLTEPMQLGDQIETVAAIRKITSSFGSAVPLVPAARAHPDLFADLLQHGFSENELFLLVIPKRTLARRRSDHELLTVEETDKAMRLMRIVEQAQRVFGEPSKAHRWLRKSKRELSGQTPLIFLSSEAGARVVEEMLHRIEHGIFA